MRLVDGGRPFGDDRLLEALVDYGCRLGLGGCRLRRRRGVALRRWPGAGWGATASSIRDAIEGEACRDIGSGNGSWVVRGDRRTRLGDAGIVLAPGDRVVTIDGIELLRVVEH